MQDRWSDVGGMRVYSRDGGGAAWIAPVLVLVHGVGLSGRYMIPLARHLRGRFRVHVPDLPGFGWSAGNPPAVTVREQAEALRDWMDALGLERASILGNALGSQVAIEFAVRYGDRTNRLVLVGPSPEPGARTPFRQLGRQLLNMPLEPLPMQALYALDHLQGGVVRMLRTIARTCDDPVETKLARVRAETLVVRGRFDRVVPQEWAQQVAGLLPRGELVVVPNAAHCVHFTRAAYVARLVAAFLERPEVAPRREVREASPQSAR